MHGVSEECSTTINVGCLLLGRMGHVANGVGRSVTLSSFRAMPLPVHGKKLLHRAVYANPHAVQCIDQLRSSVVWDDCLYMTACVPVPQVEYEVLVDQDQVTLHLLIKGFCQLN